AGQITAAEARSHPHRHVVTRALGVEPSVAVDTWLVTPESGDRYLICSDGLINEVVDERITSVLREHADPQAAAAARVAAANNAGGRDNISVVVLDVVHATGRGGDDATPTAAIPTTAASEGGQQLGGWLSDDMAGSFDETTDTATETTSAADAETP